MDSPTPVLAVGQRYLQTGDPAWGHRPVTVARLGADRFGEPLVAFRFPDGREVTAYATQVAVAVAAGYLVPVVAAPGARAA
jgi:hypothetical protein